jgi:hypothetical protein
LRCFNAVRAAVRGPLPLPLEAGTRAGRHAVQQEVVRHGLAVPLTRCSTAVFYLNL